MKYSSLSEILQIDSSRAVVDVATGFVGSDEMLFDEVLDLAVNAKYPINMRAARVVEQSVRRYAVFASQRMNYIVTVSISHSNDGVKRSFLKIIDRFLPDNIPEDLLGLVIHNCFQKLNGIEPVAVKTYSIDCLLKILKREPDLKHELIESLENQIGLNTLSLDRKIKKTLKLIDGK